MTEVILINKLLNEPIYTVYVGKNSTLIKNASDLYFKKGDKIADVTYGKGVFWKDIKKDKFEVVGTDLMDGIDFRHLPYENNSFDHSVIDPPYARISNLKGMTDSYQTTNLTSHKDIIELYNDGLIELKRITKPGGYIFCKCQDEVHGGRQQWSHIEIYNIATELGLYSKDLFILINNRGIKINHKQKHARKNHSYLWVFQVKK